VQGAVVTFARTVACLKCMRVQVLPKKVPGIDTVRKKDTKYRPTQKIFVAQNQEINPHKRIDKAGTHGGFLQD